MEEMVDASEDERGVGVAMLLVLLLLLGVAVGFDLEWKYFFKSCRMTDSISYGRTFPSSLVSCLASAGLAIQKRVIEYKIVGGGVPGDGVGGDVRRNAHRMVLQQDRPHHVPQLRRDPVRSCQEGERVMVIAVYQMDRRLDKVFVAELLFQVLQVMRVRHWRLLVVHIR